MFSSSTSDQSNRPSGTPFDTSHPNNSSSSTPFSSSHQNNSSSGTSLSSSQRNNSSSGTLFSPFQRNNSSSGTPLSSSQQDSRFSGFSFNSPFSSRDNFHQFGSTHHDHPQPQNTQFEPGYPKTGYYSNRSFVPTQNGFYWSLDEGRNYEAKYKKPDYMRGTRDPFEGIMSGTGDIKREWDRGHQNGSWNIDSNGGFSFHHEEYSNRGIEFYPNIQFFQNCQNPGALTYAVTTEQQSEETSCNTSWIVSVTS